MVEATNNVAPHPTAERAQLYNVDAEKALLGAVFMENRILDALADLKPEDFALAAHGRIFDAVRQTVSRGAIADSITMQKFFASEDALQEIGGPAYLDDITASAVTVVNAKEYARIIRDLHCKRELHGVLIDAQQGLALDRPVGEQLERLESLLFGLAEKGKTSAGLRPLGAFIDNALGQIEEAYRNQGPVAGVDTGFADLDRILNPLTAGRLIILAGRPAMGKSALAWNIIKNAAKQGQVALFTPEMAGEELAQRDFTGRTQISQGQMIRGEIHESDLKRLANAGDAIRHLPIHIDDTGTITVSAIKAKARRLKRKHGLKLIVVDYLQLIEPEQGGRSRNDDVSGITRGLKLTARDLDVPVLALSQLSRRVEERDNKRPMLSDLRDSGAIEQDADAVAFLYREVYYVEKAEPKQRERETNEKYAERYADWSARCSKIKYDVEAIVAKQRFGPTGTALMHFNPERMEFGNRAYQEGMDI